MKKLISLGIALVLTSPAALALAMSEDSTGRPVPGTSYALSTLPAAERAALTPLTDAQLASVEGAGRMRGWLSLLKQWRGKSGNFKQIIQKLKVENGGAVSVAQITQSDQRAAGGAVNSAQISQSMH